MKFEDFVKQGFVKIHHPDKPRSDYLVDCSANAYKFMNDCVAKMGITDDYANEIMHSCYNAIMELVRAKMLLEGYHTTGARAHEAEISFMRNMGVDENEVLFVNQMRYFRNGALYYGTFVDKEYAEKVVAFTKGIVPKLKNKL